MSALLNSASASLSGVESARPTLTPTCTPDSPRANGLAERLDQGRGRPLDVSDRVDALEEDGELVAGEPGHRVGGPHGLDQPLGDGLQQPVAGVVAERVVDVLEVVEVEEHHGDVPLGPTREGERVLDAIAEQIAVGQLRQRVVKRQLAQLLFEPLALADVAQVERQTLHRGVVAQVSADDLERDAVDATLHVQLHRADRAGGSRRDLGEEPFE